MYDAPTVARIQRKFAALDPVLDERSRRHWAASEALEWGHGGITLVAVATGMARDTIRRGLLEVQQRLANPHLPWLPRVRQAGGGRKPLRQTDPDLLAALRKITTPENIRKIAGENWMRVLGQAKVT